MAVGYQLSKQNVSVSREQVFVRASELIVARRTRWPGCTRMDVKTIRYATKSIKVSKEKVWLPSLFQRCS